MGACEGVPSPEACAFEWRASGAFVLLLFREHWPGKQPFNLVIAPRNDQAI